MKMRAAQPLFPTGRNRRGDRGFCGQIDTENGTTIDCSTAVGLSRQKENQMNLSVFCGPGSVLCSDIC
jgi:hypothetical protein